MEKIVITPGMRDDLQNIAGVVNELVDAVNELRDKSEKTKKEKKESQ